MACDTLTRNRKSVVRRSPGGEERDFFNGVNIRVSFLKFPYTIILGFSCEKHASQVDIRETVVHYFPQFWTINYHCLSCYLRYS